MNQDYNWIFDERYRRYARHDPDFPIPEELLLSRIRFEIDSATEKLGKTLRADAKVFLLINLYEMYVRPIALQRFLSRQAMDEVLRDLSPDLEMILRQSASLSNPGNEITARHILSATATNSVYENLKLTLSNVWG
jgi:hypothetical protein